MTKFSWSMDPPTALRHQPAGMRIGQLHDTKPSNSCDSGAFFCPTYNEAAQNNQPTNMQHSL